MGRAHRGSWLERERAQDDCWLEGRFCSVAAAVIGSAVVGAVASSSAAGKAADSSAAATAAQGEATQERLDFDKQMYADGSADRKFASDMSRTMATNQAEDRTKYNALQDEQIARGRVFQKSEDQMLVDANNYNTKEHEDQMAGRAMADVNQGFANAKGQSERSQQRMGVNPSSGRSLAMNNQMSIAQASGMAGAANGARLQAETTGRAMKMDALGLGKGMIGNQATQAGLQLNAGNSAVSNGTVPLNVSGAANNSMSQGYGNAASGFGNIASTQRANFNSAQSYGNSVGANVGNMFGSVMQRYGSGMANAFNFGSSGNNYNGGSTDPSAANYTNQMDLM